MTKLFISNGRVESVFQLLGQKENDISYSVGYAFCNCRQLLKKFLQYIKIKTPFYPDKTSILLQTHEGEKGFTDLEIIQENGFHIIIEAKRGWSFPTREQLEKYANRPSFKNAAVKDKRIIVFNESTADFASAHFGIKEINSIPVEVVSWHDILRLITVSKTMGRDYENHLLQDIKIYLDKISTMQKIDSNWVYIVSLASGNPNKWSISWQDIVNKNRKYFHPVGGGIGGWPPEPPNYIAFRYNGILQSIHHVDKYEVFTDPSKHFNEAHRELWPAHYLYHLGPPIRPEKQIRAGVKIIRSMRVWAMLDLLLTSKTIQEARDKSDERENQGG